METTGLVVGMFLMVAGIALVLVSGFRALAPTWPRGLFLTLWLPFATGVCFVLLGRWLIP